MTGNALRCAAEQEPLHTAHAAAPEHNQVRADFAPHAQYRLVRPAARDAATGLWQAS